MTEIAQLFESALRHNRSVLLRPAAMRAVEQMPASATIRDLMACEAAAAIRDLTLDDLALALTAHAHAAPQHREPRRVVVSAVPTAPVSQASKEEAVYRDILQAIAIEPLTIGQLAKQLSLDSDEVRGYLDWMKKVGKVVASGRARATRYSAAS